ncbi:unnamed protein product [Dicrocoelium dendriticum]|nr:unnamed protein product [Dicrocoelium dendriticum]
MLRTTLEGEKDEVMNITKRLTTIVDLYRDLGYRRRAGFVAWQAFVQNLRLPGEENFDALFSGLAIQFTPSNAFDSILWVHYTESHSTEDAARRLFLRCPGTPANLIPLTVPETSLWFRGSSGGVRSGTLAHTFFKPNRSAKRWWTKSHRMLPERLTYRHTGWASLQASAVWIMIQRLKADLRFDDVTDISWEMALRLTGFIFSLLDCWPDYLDEIRTEACLDDLRRLAVMRSPDQPRIADPSASFFTSDISGNADSQCRHHKIQGGLANGSLLKRSSGILRQLVDLLEVPTHGLPSVHPTTGERVPSQLSQSTDSAVYNTNSDRPPGLFYYAPTELNGKTQENFKVIDWVCEEPVAIELMVDNLLPVSLRLSDIRIELSQVFTGPITCTSTPNASTNVLLSSGRPGPVLVHLEAFRVSLEKSVTGVRTPLGTRHRASTPFTTAYGVELNQACLLESAHFKYLHPYVKLDAVWQRRLGHVRCTIPAKTIGNRLVIHVVPPTSMLLAVDNQPHAIESSARSYYRVSGISYRLVDFGAMHACLRVPSDLLYLDPVVNLPHEIPQTPVHERHLSHSSSSALSISSGLRSSATCETDSALNSILPSDSLPQHPIVSLIRNLFFDLPAIRLRPAMPRLCIFPGIARSAPTLTEAANFLPQLTVPLVNTDNTAKLTTSPLDISAPKFHIPVSEHWSQHVATLFHVSVYPYESRWLPLRIFVRDEAQQATTSPQSHVIPPTASRQLNVLHISVKSTDESAQLLRKLNLIPNDLVKCHNWDSIQRKMPFPVCNKQIAMTPVVCISDGVYLEDDSVSPTHATECGLIWLSFHSEAFWRNLYRWFTQPLRRKDQDMKDIGFRNSQAVMLEIHIEYALDAPCKENHSTIHTNGPQLFPEQPTLARRVGIGIHLSLLSSKHSPLLLYYPQLTFRDELERQSSDSKVPNSMGIAANVDPESKALFSCTLRARLPASLVPRHLRSPGRQYRVRLEVSSKWTTPGAQLDQPAFTISTPWTSLFEQNSHIPVSTRISTQALSPVSAELDGPVSPFVYTTTEMFHSLGDLDAIAVSETTSSDHLTYHHHINLPMEQLSNVVFGSGDVHLVNSKELSTDEIGLPLPMNTEATIHLIESHIWITWKSWLDGRLSHSPNTSSMERLNVMLPDSRFYRFGRLCLAAHNVELPVPEQPSLADAQAKSTVSRYWFGNVFTNLASTAGLLWCHNLHLTLNMPKPMSRPEFPEFNLQNICHSCLGDSAGRKILPSFSRCMSQPTESFSSHMPKATTSQPLGGLDEINENTPWDSAANPAPHRRFSIPEFRHPRQLQGVPANLLPSFLHICVPLMSPLPLRVESRVAYNPMDDLHVVDPRKQTTGSYVFVVSVLRLQLNKRYHILQLWVRKHLDK